jgi:hypothetical protein
VFEVLHFIGTMRAVETYISENPKGVENVVGSHPIRDLPAMEDMFDHGQRMLRWIVALQCLQVGIAYLPPALYDPVNGLLTCGFTDLRQGSLRHVNSVLTCVILSSEVLGETPSCCLTALQMSVRHQGCQWTWQ